jgi:hypothetical protein
MGDNLPVRASSSTEVYGHTASTAKDCRRDCIFVTVEIERQKSEPDELKVIFSASDPFNNPNRHLTQIDNNTCYTFQHHG